MIKKLKKNLRGKLLLKKIGSQDLKRYLNIFKFFYNLRFLNSNKHLFSEFKYLSNYYLKNLLYSVFDTYFRSFLYLFKFKRFPLKRKYYNIAYLFKEWKIRFSIIKKRYLKVIKKFLKLKFKRKFVEKKRYVKNIRIKKKKKKKTKLNLLYENNLPFLNKLSDNLNRLEIRKFFLKRGVIKKVTKKQMKFLLRSRKKRSYVLKKIAHGIIYKKPKKWQGKKIIFNHKYKGSFKEKKAAAYKAYKSFYRNEKKIRRYLKRRRKKIIRKFLLIKKYKRIKFRRKRRTGILHFRKYFSNYYITLTDLSHNVIFTCSAGSVCTGNKKTKMSNSVGIPIFYRLKFFLRAFKIRNLKFVFRTKIDKMYYIAYNFFKKKGFKIRSYSLIFRAPHHLGQRKQKPRRI